MRELCRVPAEVLYMASSTAATGPAVRATTSSGAVVA